MAVTSCRNTRIMSVLTMRIELGALHNAQTRRVFVIARIFGMESAVRSLTCCHGKVLHSLSCAFARVIDVVLNITA